MKGVSHTDPQGQDFALRVMDRLRKACDDWKKETNIGFALYLSLIHIFCCARPWPRRGWTTSL